MLRKALNARILHVIVLFLTLANLACRREPTKPNLPVKSTLKPFPKVSQVQAPQTSIAASQPSREGGVIAGVIKYDGPTVPPRTLDTSADPRCDKQLLAEDLIVNQNNTLANVFVYIDTGVPPTKIAPSTSPVYVDIRDWRFDPHVLGAQVGQKFVCRNDSGVALVLTVENGPPALGRVPGFRGDWPFLPRMQCAETLGGESIPVILGVRDHPWMRAYVCVVDHQYFNVTNEAGAFRFEQLDKGTYIVRAWHETLGTKQIIVELDDNEVAWLDIQYD